MSGRAARAAKRAIDVAASAAGLVAVSPVLAAAGLAIRKNLGSPVLFRQERPGLHGRPFTLYKFRTMRAPRPGEDSTTSDRERLTPLGEILRRTSIDELPTLWNVLRGDMSLVGPRPLLMEYLDRYTPEQARRHDVKPGITGWAQVNGRNALTWERKFELDVWYVDSWSLFVDLRILAMTVAKVMRREGISHAGEATMAAFMGTPAANPEE
jgi:lipopolysaccharide/colanic/teichoic acid biosynthesis glycosyltransferase